MESSQNNINKVIHFGQSRPWVLLLACIVLAIGLRAWGLTFGLPYVYHPDEVVVVNKALVMLKTGNLNPHFFNWPSLTIYLNMILYGLYFLIGKLLGIFQSTADIPAPQMLGMAVGYVPMASLWLSSRILTMVMGIGTAILTFLSGRSLTGKRAVAFIAALLVAISPTIVTNNRLIAPDSFALFFLMLAFYGIVRLFQTGQTRYYMLTGIAIGLAGAAKYNAVLIALPFLLVHFQRQGWAGLKDRRLYGTAVLSVAAFLIAMPYAVLDFTPFWTDFRFNAQHYSTGHAGMEGNTLAWYLTYLWRSEGLVFILATVEWVRGMIGRSRQTMLLAIFPVIYFIFISRFVVRNNRTLLLILPFLFLLTANLLVFGWAWLNRQSSYVRRRVGLTVLLLITAVTLIVPLRATIENSIHLTMIDSRETARVWIADHLPAGTKVTLESYAPYVDPQQFTVQWINSLKDKPLTDYQADGSDYLIFSQGSYGRFFKDPERYAPEIAAYEALWSQMKLVQIFEDGGYEVRIYAVP
jgi:4-amino-4-deoxy-L-arabinose transferase-like glycosyltransferase